MMKSETSKAAMKPPAVKRPGALFFRSALFIRQFQDSLKKVCYITPRLIKGKDVYPRLLWC
jgi:hypothetical protein